MTQYSVLRVRPEAGAADARAQMVLTASPLVALSLLQKLDITLRTPPFILSSII